MDKFYMESSSGVVFVITPIGGQYRVHIKAISENEECTSYVPVYSKCIKKYAKLIHCNEFYDRFEAMTEPQQQQYIARYLRGEGQQKVNVRREMHYIVKRVVTKQLFVRRDTGKWRMFDTYSNPERLRRAIARFKRNGYRVFTETGQARLYRIPVDQLKDAIKHLIIEEKDESYGTMALGVAKKVRSARFWQDK